MRQTKALKDIHADALARFDRIQTALREEREQCLEDRRFCSIPGAQWEGSLETQFENKPKFEMNKIHNSVMKIINEYRSNRISVDFISKDGKTNMDMADVCDGLFRADEQDSGAIEAYDNAFEEAVGGGFGALRLVCEYEDEEDEENDKQRIRIEPIYDADSSVFFDLDAKRQDKADAKYCFVMYSMTPEDYEFEYDEDPSDLEKQVSQTEYDWNSPDQIYVAEYYLLERKKVTLRVFENLTGQKEYYCDEDFEENPELESRLAAIGTREVSQKTIKKQRVHKYIMDGAKVLEDCGLIAGKYIPVIPTYGKRWYVDGVERCMGHVRLAKDAQRLKNMLMSWLAEISARPTVEKPIFTAEQVAGYEDEWAEDNIKNYPLLRVNSITDAQGNLMPSGPIAYTKLPQIPPAMSALLQIVDVDLKELMGSMTEPDKIVSHVSGKAQELVQQRIDGQAYIYMSNFSKAIKRAGEIWLSMAKDVYVEEGRDMKTIDPSGEISTVKLMQPGVVEGEGVTETNDISKATFDVSVSVGPTSESQRTATVQSIVGMLAITSDQETAKVLQAMALMNMEGDGISEARNYFRQQLVRMGVITPTAEEQQKLQQEAQNKQPSANDQALLAMAQKERADAQKKQAETQKVVAETQKVKAETLDTLDNVNMKKVQENRAIIDQQERIRQQRVQEAQADLVRRAAEATPQQSPNPQQTPNVG